MDNMIIAPLLGCLITALFTLLFFSHKGLQRFIHLLGTIFYLFFTAYLYWLVQQKGLLFFRLGNHPAGFAISFILDDFSCLMLLITAITVLAVSIYSMSDSTINSKMFFYPAFWFLISGVTGSFSTADLFNLYVWFEVMIISSAVIMTLTRENILPGMVYYITLNVLATLIMLLSISFLYGLSDTLDMAQLALKSHTYSAAYLPILTLLIIAFAIKSALFPYYFWLPVSYHLTSVSAGGLLAGLLTKVGVYALIRIGTLFLSPHSPLMPILLSLSCLTMLGGVFGAMSDFHIRRILSFHIISQIGYMTLGIAIGTTFALTAAIFYIIHHILVKTNLFLISGLLTRYSGYADLRQMGGFFQKKPLLTILFFIPAFSLAGLPPLSGFWAKYLILDAALTSKFWLSAFLALLVGFFTLYSMIKIWRYVFLQSAEYPMRPISAKDRIFLYSPIFLLGTLTLFIGLYPQPLYKISGQAAHALLNPSHYLQTVHGKNTTLNGC
ncbi:proton-conducting transporter membrane subunit [Legionella nagasakiensis]|uniref:proton-conducting transporter transmembrane domain-containing protein n=1 Tax=Legionella nagasakiensis TaxID=535290 RepID=UPI0010541EBB|nr:proton-conducting transporter membrane subunit [Legionella nagasakiensis]